MNIQEFQNALDQRDTSISAKLARIDELANENDALKGRIEEIESRRNQPGLTAVDSGAVEHKKRFLEYIRKSNDSQRMNDLYEIEKRLIERKDITAGTSADGGFAVPEVIATEIERLEQSMSPVRRIVKVVRASSGDYKHLLNIRGSSSGWVGESGSRSATNTSQLRERAPTFGELYAYPQVSEWALDDIFFDVEAWLAEEVADQFAIAEGSAVISGDGSNKPTGMLHTTPVTTEDFASPLRAAAAYQYLAAVSTHSPAVAEIASADSLIDLVFSLKSQYRVGANWVMNSQTAGALRKLKDSNGQYLWQPSLQADQPDRLLGYSVEIWEQMQDIGTNNFPVAFGNFRRGYLLADRVGLRITRDNITNPGFVRFYVRRREGGIVLNNDAIKFLRTTLS